jgi:hypothetical protein
MLALVLPAGAKIVYTPAHHIIKQRTSFRLDLNHDGITDFTLQNAFTQGSVQTFASVLVKSPKGNGAEGWTGFHPYAFALKRGARIGSRQYFPGVAMASVVRDSELGTYYNGSWLNVKNRYLGLKFKINGKTPTGGQG